MKLRVARLLADRRTRILSPCSGSRPQGHYLRSKVFRLVGHWPATLFRIHPVHRLPPSGECFRSGIGQGLPGRSADCASGPPAVCFPVGLAKVLLHLGGFCLPLVPGRDILCARLPPVQAVGSDISFYCRLLDQLMERFLIEARYHFVFGLEGL